MKADRDIPGSTPSLVKGLKKILNDLEQIRTDISQWNNTRLDQPAIDLGEYLIAIKHCKAAIAHGEGGKRKTMEQEFDKVKAVMKQW